MGRVSKLRERLQRLREPVEVDRIGDVIGDADRAVRLQVEALAGRITDAAAELRQLTRDVTERTEAAQELHEETAAGTGILATLRATVANDQVEEARDNAAGDLLADAAALARKVERCLALAEDVDTLLADLDFATAGLGDLGRRAAAGGLTREAGEIQAVLSGLRALRGPLPALADPLEAPVVAASAVVEVATVQAAELRSTERAATLGEAALDRVISPTGGSVARRLRDAVGQVAPALVPDVERDAMGQQDALDALGMKVDAATRAARGDEALRRAAEAELDALEWDPSDT